MKVTYSVALVSIFLSAENENWQLEDLPKADFGHLPEWLLLSIRTKSINENFVNWKLWYHLFSFINEVGFLLSKGLLCLYDKQNNTWLLVDMEFLFSCLTRHITRSLHSLVSYQVKRSKINSISTCAHILFSIYF